MVAGPFTCWKARAVYGISGRPDYVLLVEGLPIPVEEKTGRVPKGPLFSALLPFVYLLAPPDPHAIILDNFVTTVSILAGEDEQLALRDVALPEHVEAIKLAVRNCGATARAVERAATAARAIARPRAGPSPGPATRYPNASRMWARLAWTWGWENMRSFIAGQITTGARVASSVVPSRSSARP